MIAVMLEVSFVRRRGKRDRVYVHRSDGTMTGWDFPSYGDGLPHDMCHLVVEDELGLVDGFWGLVEQGVDVALVDNQATLVRNGASLGEHVGTDLTGLVEAEVAVAALAPGIGAAGPGTGGKLPPSATPDAVAAIHRRLRVLATEWRDLKDGAAMSLLFPGQ